MNIMICMAVSRLLFFAKGARQINKIMIVSLSCFDLYIKGEKRAIDLLTANPYKLHPTDSKFFQYHLRPFPVLVSQLNYSGNKNKEKNTGSGK